MKDDPVYVPTDCFETFPFPANWKTSTCLETAGTAYYEFRGGLMVSRNEGMTKIYNRFHDPAETAGDIQRLRELHTAMDRAVLESYGWHDLAAHSKAIFLDQTNEDDYTYQGRLFWPADFREEILSRLLTLNAERAAVERAAGLTAAPEEEEPEMDREEEEA
jgi:hypothetical protein